MSVSAKVNFFKRFPFRFQLDLIPHNLCDVVNEVCLMQMTHVQETYTRNKRFFFGFLAYVSWMSACQRNNFRPPRSLPTVTEIPD